MALVLKDRVRETTTVTSTGTVTLLGAAAGFQSFNTAIPSGSNVYYCIAEQSGSDWEVGYGTFTSPNQLSRDSVYESSNAGSLVNFSSGVKDVFITYPAEKAIYEENNGETLIDGGPITVIGSNVTSVPSLPAELGKFVADVDLFAQIYNFNQNDGANASADFVAYNDLTTTGYTNFIDFGINSSNYSSVDYPLFTPGSAYLFNDGNTLFMGSQTHDVQIFAGGVNSNTVVAKFNTDLSANITGSLNVGNAISVTGPASFSNTVLLSADPTLPLQAATKQYVDLSSSTGIHIHQPVRVERGSNLNATYAQGGTTFNITTISGNKTLTTDVNHGLAINDVIWLYSTGGNGLVINTPYFVYSIPALNQMTISANFDGAEITTLTNATGLSYATRANAGVGATLTNAGSQAALVIDSVTVSVADRVLVYGQTTGYENGVYVVTDTGSNSTNWVLTRASDQDVYNPDDVNGMSGGDYFFVQEGATGAGESYVCTNVGSIAIGYSTISYTQFNASPTYVGGTNINIAGQTISLTGTVAPTNGGTGVNTVATGDILYGSGTDTWGKLAAGSAYKSLVMNAGGTQVEWNAIALNQSGAVSGSLPATNGGTGQSNYATGDMLYSSAADTLSKLTGNQTTTKKFLGQTGTGSASQAPVWEQPAASDITGLAPSATTDTSNASNITSGTLPVGRLTGEYTGITGVGVLANGTWTANTIAVAYGGTGAINATNARTNLGLIIGANVQAYSFQLQSLADISSNGILARTASNTITATALTTKYIPYGNGTGSFGQSSSFVFDGINVGIGTSSPSDTNSWGRCLDIRGTSTSGYAGTYFGNSDLTVRGYVGAGGASGSGQAFFGTSTSTPLIFYTANSEKMRLDSSGNLGLGVTPSSWYSSWKAFQGDSLAISGNTELQQMSSACFDTAGTFLYTSSFYRPTRYQAFNGTHQWYTAPSGPAGNAITFTQVMTLDANGNLGIGTDIPSTKLQVAGVGGFTGVAGTTTIGCDSTGGYIEATTSIPLRLYTGGSERVRLSSAGGFSVGTTADPGAGAIYATGNITAYYSDDRLKTKLGGIENALDKVKSLSGFYYEANQTAQDLGYQAVREVGVSAQQVQAVMPEVVKPAPIDQQYLTVDYERLVPLLIEAIKELEAQVAELKAK